MIRYSKRYPQMVLAGFCCAMHSAPAPARTQAVTLNAPAVPPAPTLVRGPYLQKGTPTSLVVRWRTDFPANSRVLYGTNALQLTLAAGNTALTNEHILRLTSLVPNTTYFYAVGTSTTNLAAGADYSFVTAPARPKPTRIWAIGDSGTASAGYFGSYQVRDAYQRFAGTNRADVWLMLGDNAYSTGTDEQYQVAVFETYPELLRQTMLWPAIGNHETYAPYPDGRFAYLDIFSPPTRGEAGGVPSGTKRYYSFDYGSIHFVCLDSETSPRTNGAPMLRWLEQDLAAQTNTWLVAFWHSPPYSKGSHNSDSLADSGGRLVEMRQYVVPILESYGVDLVLCGHSHNYERSYLLNGHYGFSSTLQPTMLKDSGSGRPDDTGPYIKSEVDAPSQGAVYVVAGSSGWATFATGRHPAMYIQLLQMGSLVIDIDGNRLDAKFLRETGVIDDYFTLLKGQPPEPLRITTVQRGASNTILRWKSQSGHQYQVEATGELPASQWIPLGNPVTATGATTSWTNANQTSPDQLFYRVLQTP